MGWSKIVTVFILGILGGIDNLQVSSALGLMGLKRQRRLLIMVPFVFFDTVMSFLGLLIGNKLNLIFERIADWLGPGFIIFLGIYIIVKEYREDEIAAITNKRWFMLMLPVLMSFDNLFAGLGLGTAGYAVIFFCIAW